VYICTQCNQPVPNPVKGKCPRGHLLTDHNILGATREQSFGESFFKTVGVCILIFLVTAAILALLQKPSSSAGYILVALMALGILALFRALKWKRQGGAVARLVPRATGMAVACILTGGALFFLGLALGLIR
jgi:predicted ABC-type exoprotein transport system permease subunit